MAARLTPFITGKVYIKLSSPRKRIPLKGILRVL
jgi:hypothetical protein